jgi:hypothetical protein
MCASSCRCINLGMWSCSWDYILFKGGSTFFISENCRSPCDFKPLLLHGVLLLILAMQVVFNILKGNAVIAPQVVPGMQDRNSPEQRPGCATSARMPGKFYIQGLGMM